jgi:integrase
MKEIKCKENRDDKEMNSLDTFLSTLAKSARANWKRGIELYCEWSNKTVDQILEERKQDLTPKPNESPVEKKQRSSRYEKELEKFHAYLLSKDYKINTARTYITGMLQLFRYYDMPITLRQGSPLSQTTIAVGEFNLKPEHVRAMFHAAKDLRSQLIISLANDLGCGIQDLITIQRNELPDLNQPTPLYWERQRGKTKQVVKTCLSETTVKLLKEYLLNFPTKNPYLFNSNGGHIGEELINGRLRDLARDANINLGNRSLHYHLFRKMIISTGKNLGIDSDVIKVMTGKSVNKSMLTYMTDVNIIEAFKKLQSVTAINGQIIKSESEDQIMILGRAYAEQQQQIEKIASVVNTLIEHKNLRDGEFTEQEKEAIRKYLGIKESDQK